MRARTVMVALVVLAALVGCTISRNIEDVQPPRQQRLENLEQNLNYSDPSAGQSDYTGAH